MKTNNYEITIIIPLYDRHIYTEIWLKENIRSDFYYIFADGSKTDVHQEIFNNLKLDNVEYIRYKTDDSSYQFFYKMYDAASKVKTDYVMTSDNDDFLNHKGIKKCINFLKKNNNYICASGMILNVTNNLNNFKKLSLEKVKYKIYPKVTNELINLDNYKGLEGTIRYLDNSFKTNYLWYAIYRKNEYKKIWQELKYSKIEDLGFIELLQTCYSFYYGRYKYIDCNHYIRLVNTINNNTSNFHQNFFNRFKDNGKSWNDLNIFYQNLMEKYHIDKKYAEEITLKYFHPDNNNKKNFILLLLSNLIMKPLDLTLRFFLKFEIYFNIKFIKKIFNSFILVFPNNKKL